MARPGLDPRLLAPCALVDRPLVSEITFCAWVAQAGAGEALVYHRGFLVVDTDKLLSRLAPEARLELRRLADAAFRAAEQGLVHLVQARLATDRFAYIAIARPKPRRSGAALSMRLLEAA
ncbi:MAG: hypothetical protein JJU40_03835 [Rhodobacteraceae bacterium]|nr:hypothetical protein [Paracoccaceae bacterium]